ncbi:hypothetical protein [Streptomyces roseochromogenus]|uniref:Uncharacterized protein n=1 Tax=Streptomyces roseochromogenus subsp. oscitans DS 12.976 TaxID=1352936 RepID=V6JMK3_STRRC|nr:hypothetical protein [Streptomyces roseochromogenus]EST18074.1 hypothetical protein M878_45765 [Streptomyces roseochromogenus subsp. oscitans DS 12.976]
MAGEVWVATHNTDAWQTAGNRRRSVAISLIRAEDIRTVFLQTRDDLGSAVVALVTSPGMDGRGASTVLVNHTERTGEEAVPELPPLFHLDLTLALSQARQVGDEEPLYVRAEYENGQWHWRIHTYEQLHERIELANLAADSL